MMETAAHRHVEKLVRRCREFKQKLKQVKVKKTLSKIQWTAVKRKHHSRSKTGGIGNNDMVTDTGENTSTIGKEGIISQSLQDNQTSQKDANNKVPEVTNYIKPVEELGEDCEESQTVQKPKDVKNLIIEKKDAINVKESVQGESPKENLVDNSDPIPQTGRAAVVRRKPLQKIPVIKTIHPSPLKQTMILDQWREFVSY